MTSVVIDGADRYPFWIKSKSVNATGPNTRVSFIIENLSPKFGFVFDQLQVWFDETTHHTTREEFETSLRNTRLSFEFDGQGLTPGQYSLTIHVLNAGIYLETVNFTESIEIRDTSVPAVIDGAVLPTAILNTQRVFVLLGISGARKLLDDHVSLDFQVRHGSREERGQVFGRAVKLSTGQDHNQNYQKFIAQTGMLDLMSDKLTVQYRDVVKRAESTVEPDEEIALLLVKTPAASVNGTVRGIVTAETRTGSNLRFEFDLDFFAPPSTAAEVTKARTLEGSAKGLIEGGYMIEVSLSNFVITYNITHLKIEFCPRSEHLNFWLCARTICES
jgi:hypothetical protein